MTRIVKNTEIIRLPKSTKSVQRALNSAQQKAKEQRWRKIVIIGEGPYGFRIHNSNMKYYELIGLLAYSQQALITEADE